MKKKIRTNAKSVREAIRNHLIEIAQNDDVLITTVDEAIDYIVNKYIVEFGKYNNRLTIQEGFIYWLNGLALHTYYYTEDIINYLHSIGLYGKNKRQEQEKSADLYHYLIFKEVKNKLFNKMEE